jgi:hypothetical protein
MATPFGSFSRHGATTAVIISQNTTVLSTSSRRSPHITASRTKTLRYATMSKQETPSMSPTPESRREKEINLFVLVGGAGGTVLLLMLTGIIILQCVILCQKKKKQHSAREGDLGERRVNVYSDCSLVAAPYESPGRGLRNERSHHTTKELDECIGQRSAPSTESLHTMTTTIEEEYAVPHAHIKHKTPQGQNGKCALQPLKQGPHRASYPVLDRGEETTKMEEDYSLPQDHINHKLPRSKGARSALSQEHRNRTGNKPAAPSVAESSQADGGEHVYSTLEPPCGLLEKSCEETKTLSQNGTRLTQF